MTATKSLPRPLDTRVPAKVRAAIVAVCGCDDAEVRFDARLLDLGLSEPLDLTELTIELEDVYACSLEEAEDAIDETWPRGTVLTVIDTLHKAGVAL